MTIPLSETQNLKKRLRQQARSMRQELTEVQLQEADIQLAQQFELHFSREKFNTAGIYLQNDNELGTEHLIRLLFQSNCKVYLPVISDYSNNQMEFVHYQQQSQMQTNRFGIPEPADGENISVDQLDIIFLPLTAFDLRGHRLGMGGGFYDRALAKVSGEKPILVGLAYDFQELPTCPAESFDHSLQMIMTPNRVIHF
ncbi:MAG: 5-formyltetrahydrofolate cyclo-ligase [Gammaproteobacteria bacterium]|nr:5-formyltetrahydrofolate cyclo-ligase [Gammaproteobacteria bacterium]